MNFAICDDEACELQKIEDFLLRFDPKADYECFSSAQELLQAFKTKYYNIVLLDIEMTGLNGFQAACELNKLPTVPLIIFITQSGNYTVQGYGVAFRYLQKPLSYLDFEYALSAAVSKVTPKLISVKSMDGFVFLQVTNIVYIETFNYHVFLHTHEKTYESRISLKKLDQELKGCHFFRPHNSYLINLDYVSYAEKDVVVLDTGIKIPISRNRQKSFEIAMFDFLRRW